MPVDQQVDLVLERYDDAHSEVQDLGTNLDPDALEAVAKEVIARVAARMSVSADQGHAATQSELEQLCRDLISDDMDAGRHFIDRIRDDGVSIDTVYLSYLSGAARLLGTWWDDDTITFGEVTVGCGRIYAIMRSISQQHPPNLTKRHAIFATVPGEEHTLGIKAAADLLERRGWSITLKSGLWHEQLVDEISGAACPILGLSVGGEKALPALARLIIAVRLESPKTKIIVGGQELSEAETAVQAMRPDAMAMTMQQTYAAIERLWRAHKETV